MNRSRSAGVVSSGICLLLAAATGLGAETFLRSSDGSGWRSDHYEVRNQSVRMNRRLNVGLWRYFMHGRTDFEAKPVAFDDLVQFDGGTGDWLVEQRLKNPHKESTLKAVRLAGRQRRILPKCVFDIGTLFGMKGRRIRFFVWMKGRECGMKTDLLTGAPKVLFFVKDGLGNLKSTTSGKFKTRGTFPWFCYNVEVQVPTVMDFTVKEAAPEAAEKQDSLDFILESALGGGSGSGLDDDVPAGSGLFVGFENPSDGEVLFSTLSWELVSTKNAISLADCTDPRSGSNAPNPDYDELPLHVIYTMGGFNNLNFLKGNHVTPDLLTVDGLDAYFAKSERDPFHMLHGVPYLNYFTQTGEVLKLMPPLPNGWKETLHHHLERLQDPRTGLWGSDVLVTHAIVKNNFAPTAVRRSSAPLRKTPWLAVTATGIPNAKALLKTLLDSRRPAAGGPGGWNMFSLMPEDLRRMVDMQDVHLAATAAAIELLALLKTQLPDPALRRQADDAVFAARQYVLRNFFTRDHLWKQSVLAEKVTSGNFMFNLLNATSMLDPEPLPGECSYDLAPIFNADGGISLSWKSRPPEFVSLRIYAAPKKVRPEDLKESSIVGIVERSSQHLWTMDPYHAMLLIAQAARKRWGITPANEGAELLDEKLKDSYPRIVYGEDIQEITIPLPVFQDPKARTTIDTAGKSAEEIENLKAQAVVDDLKKELSEEEIEANRIVYYSRMVNARGQVTPLRKIEPPDGQDNPTQGGI